MGGPTDKTHPRGPNSLERGDMMPPFSAAKEAPLEATSPALASDPLTGSARNSLSRKALLRVPQKATRPIATGMPRSGAIGNRADKARRCLCNTRGGSVYTRRQGRGSIGHNGNMRPAEIILEGVTSSQCWKTGPTRAGGESPARGALTALIRGSWGRRDRRRGESSIGGG